MAAFGQVGCMLWSTFCLVVPKDILISHRGLKIHIWKKKFNLLLTNEMSCTAIVVTTASGPATTQSCANTVPLNGKNCFCTRYNCIDTIQFTRCYCGIFTGLMLVPGFLVCKTDCADLCFPLLLANKSCLGGIVAEFRLCVLGSKSWFLMMLSIAARH